VRAQSHVCAQRPLHIGPLRGFGSRIYQNDKIPDRRPHDRASIFGLPCEEIGVDIAQLTRQQISTQAVAGHEHLVPAVEIGLCAVAVAQQVADLFQSRGDAGRTRLAHLFAVPGGREGPYVAKAGIAVDETAATPADIQAEYFVVAIAYGQFATQTPEGIRVGEQDTECPDVVIATHGVVPPAVDE